MVLFAKSLSNLTLTINPALTLNSNLGHTLKPNSSFNSLVQAKALALAQAI